MRQVLTDLLIISIIGILSSILILIIIFLSGYVNGSIHPAFLPMFFFPVSAISLLLFHIGSQKDPSTQTSYTLAAITAKFLFSGIIALIWFAVLKNNTYADIFLFFIVYLSFGISTVLLILKKLKNQP